MHIVEVDEVAGADIDRPTETRVSPALMRSKSHSLSKVARSAEVSYQLIFSGWSGTPGSGGGKRGTKKPCWPCIIALAACDAVKSVRTVDAVEQR